jgi:diaminopimelate epimerase
MVEQKRIRKTEMTVETLSGIKKILLNTKDGILQDVTVDMGAPVLLPEQIPVRLERISVHCDRTKKDTDGDAVVSEPIMTEDGILSVTCVSMGNPHAILFVDDVASAPVEKTGRYLEIHPAFPEGTNVEFIEVVDEETVRMRVWERGSGETLACGTGACAAVVACVLNGKTKNRVRVRLTGGDLGIFWDEKDGSVHMTGPAKRVFTGEVDPDEL